jgi:hypothetical protein
MRRTLISALALCAVAAQALPQQTTAKRKIPCKAPENAVTCYWTHGRLSVYNGTPPWRMWKIGTHRLLAIFSGPSAFPPRNNQDSLNPELPPNLADAYKAEEPRKGRLKEPLPDPAFGDFEVCPLEPERKDEMQAVCIEAVKNLFLQKSR